MVMVDCLSDVHCSHLSTGEMAYSEFIVALLKSALTASYGRVTDFLHKWDTDGTGTIQRSEFQSAIRAAGFDAPDHVIDELFDEMDVDGSGSVEYKELQRTLAPSANSSPKQTRRPTDGVEGGKGGENRGKGGENGGEGGENGAKGGERGGKGGEKGGKSPRKHLELVAVPREGCEASCKGARGGGASSQRGAQHGASTQARPCGAGGSRSASPVRATPQTLNKATGPGEPLAPSPLLASTPRVTPALVPMAVPSAELIDAKALLKHALASSLSRVADTFARWDEDGSGLISRYEFGRAVATLGLPGLSFSETTPAVTNPLHAAACEAVFAEMDVDGSGTIECAEFVRFTLRSALERSAARIVDLLCPSSNGGGRSGDEGRLGRSGGGGPSGSVARLEFHRAVRTIGIDAPALDLDAVFDEAVTPGTTRGATERVDLLDLEWVLQMGVGGPLPAPPEMAEVRGSSTTGAHAAVVPPEVVAAVASNPLCASGGTTTRASQPLPASRQLSGRQSSLMALPNGATASAAARAVSPRRVLTSAVTAGASSQAQILGARPSASLSVVQA